jgi:hypothetical protein
MRLTTIVPWFGNTSCFDETLASVLHHADEGAQTIVVHDGRFIDTYGLGNAIDSVEISGEATLAKLLNAGLAAAEGSVICVLRPGVELTSESVDQLAEVFADTNVGSVSGQLLSPRSTDKLVCAGVEASFGFSRKLVGDDMIVSRRNLQRTKPVGPTLWAAFYRVSALNSIGGFDETVESQYLDLDVALALQQAGFTCRFVADVTASMDIVKPFYREADQTHGRSAQRAIRRHGNESFGRAIISGVGELVVGMVNPSRLVHLSQRFLAGKFSRHDRVFADRLEMVSKKRKLGLKLQIGDELEVESAALQRPESSTRRAA